LNIACSTISAIWITRCAPRKVWAIVQALPIHGGEGWLNQNAYSIDELDYGQMRVLLYHAGNPARTEKFLSPIVFDNGIALLGYRLNDSWIESGIGVATVELDWQATQKIRDDFTISLRLTDLRGEKVFAQADAQPVNGLSPTSSWEAGQLVIDRRGIAIPADTPPVEYHLQVVMYQFVGNRVAIVTAPDSLRGSLVSLAKVTIVRPDAPRK
jgi:hypothetical protein